MADEQDTDVDSAPVGPRRVKRGDPGSEVEGDYPPPEQKAAYEAQEAQRAELEAAQPHRARKRRKSS
jgi:hypothetical protein